MYVCIYIYVYIYIYTCPLCRCPSRPSCPKFNLEKWLHARGDLNFQRAF